MRKKLCKVLILILAACLFQGCTRNTPPANTEESVPASSGSTLTPASASVPPADSTQTTAAVTPSAAPAVTATASMGASSLGTEGRYIAEEIPVADNQADASAYNYFDPGSIASNYIAAYSSVSKDYKKFSRSCMNYDFSWTTKELQWAANSIPDQIAWIQQITYSTDGTGYLLYFTNESDNACLPHIIRQTSDTTGEELTIPCLKKKDSNGKYPYPEHMDIDSDGTIYLLDHGICSVLQHDTHQLLYEYSSADYISHIYLTKDSAFLICPGDKTIVQYEKATGKQTNLYTYDSRNNDIAELCVNDNGQIFLLVKEGIYTIQCGNSTWEMIYDGSLGVLEDPDIFVSALILGKQNDFYFTSGNKIFHCFYSENAPSMPSNTLTVYSLYDSDNIRKAIAAFQTSYPDYKVDFQTATAAKYYRERAQLDVSDYISAVNTELLSNAGSDVLILDDLPYQAYIQKGILADLYDYVPSLQNTDVFVPGIISGSKTEGKLLALPTAFRYYSLQGTDEILQASDSIHSIAEYISKNNNTAVFTSWCYDDFVDLILNLEASSLFTKDHLKNQTELTELFQDIRAIQTMTENGLEYLHFDDIPSGYYSEEIITRNPDILQSDTYGDPYSLMDIIGMQKIRGGSLKAVHSQYIPSDIAGITSSSANKECAGKFIDILLSPDLQKMEIGRKVQPILLASLDSEKENYDEHYGVGGFHYPDEESCQQIIDLSKSLDVCRPSEPSLQKLCKEVFLDYLSNPDMDPESTASQLYNRLSIYYAE